MKKYLSIFVDFLFSAHLVYRHRICYTMNTEESGVSFVEKLLIAVMSDALSGVLVQKLHNDYILTVCHDGESAYKILREETYDILILDLNLPLLDGITLLKRLDSLRPKMIIAITNLCSDYALQSAKELGVWHILLKPCRTEAIISHISRMVDWHKENYVDRNPQRRTAILLRYLEIPEHRDGFRYLQTGIPLYVNDPTQSITKDLYPAIARLHGSKNDKAVEKAIREVVEYSWNRRNVLKWKVYFPRHAHRPTNKQFFSRLAQMLSEEELPLY